MKSKYSLFFFHVALLFSLEGLAQTPKYWLSYEVIGNLQQKALLSFSDTVQMRTAIRERFADLHHAGYLAASAQVQKNAGDTLFLTVDTGQKFEWLQLGMGNVDPVLGVKSGADVRLVRGKPFSYSQVSRLMEQVLSTYENNGYPFAAVGLDSISREDQKISAVLSVNPGPYIVFDTLKVTGDSKVKVSYLFRFLQLRPGTPFSQKQVDEAIPQAGKLPFLRWAGEPQLSFQNQEATLYLPLNERKINTIDGIIGFLPNERPGGRLLLTGQFDLALHNVSGRGRNYELRWQGFNQFSQSLAISALEPLLLGSKLDLKADFRLLKQDTTFLTRDFRLSFGYRFSSQSYLRFFGSRQAGDLLAVSGLSELTELPQVGDFRFNSYGLGWDQVWLDDLFFPRRGGRVQLDMGVGNRNILVNTAIPEELYKGLDRRTLQYFVQAKAEKHYYLRPQWGISTVFGAGWLKNPNLFINDLYRLGGLRSIRGFNENYFFANNFVHVSIEPRYYFDTYSYFMIFADVGRLGNSVQQLPVDFPMATGMGISLDTGNGVFNFIYALGRSNAQQFSLNLSKVHFGFTGRF